MAKIASSSTPRVWSRFLAEASAYQARSARAETQASCALSLGARFPLVCEARNVAIFAGPDLGKIARRRTQFGSGVLAGKMFSGKSARAADSSTSGNRI